VQAEVHLQTGDSLLTPGAVEDHRRECYRGKFLGPNTTSQYSGDSVCITSIKRSTCSHACGSDEGACDVLWHPFSSSSLDSLCGVRMNTLVHPREALSNTKALCSLIFYCKLAQDTSRTPSNTTSRLISSREISGIDCVRMTIGYHAQTHASCT
jgi:hypothetical protein